MTTSDKFLNESGLTYFLGRLITHNNGLYLGNLITGASSSATADAAATNGNVYLNLVQNGNVRSFHQLVGTNMAITCNSNGVITFAAVDEKVKQTAAPSSDEGSATAYKVLLGAEASPTSGTAYEAKYSANVTATGAGTLTAPYIVANTNFKITSNGTPLTGTAGAAEKTSTSDSLIATPAMVNAAITDAIAGVTQISYETVSVLPASGETGKIYMISHSHDGSNDSFDEYVWIATTSSYEKLGHTDVDLSGYWATANLVAITNNEIDALFTPAS